MTPLSFSIDVLSYASCVGRAERLVQAVPGVIAMQMTLLAGTASVTHWDDDASPEAPACAVGKRGRAATLHDGKATGLSDGLAAGAMALSSVFVVSNALRLRGAAAREAHPPLSPDARPQEVPA